MVIQADQVLSLQLVRAVMFDYAYLMNLHTVMFAASQSLWPTGYLNTAFLQRSSVQVKPCIYHTILDLIPGSWAYIIQIISPISSDCRRKNAWPNPDVLQHFSNVLGLDKLQVQGVGYFFLLFWNNVNALQNLLKTNVVFPSWTFTEDYSSQTRPAISCLTF